MKVVDINKTVFKRPPKNGKFYLIAIDGRGGSGKSHLTNHLKRLLPDFEFIDGDDYFEPTEGRSEWGAFNEIRFSADVIKPLQHSNSFTYRPYRWHKKPHLIERQIVVNEGLCIERLFSFGFDLDWDLKIWIETPREVSIKRGMERDSMPEDRSRRVWEAWSKKDDQYISKIKPLEVADLVLDGTKSFEEQIT